MTGDLWIGVLIGMGVYVMAKKAAATIAKRRRHPDCPDDILTHELFFVWRSIMAKLSDVQAAQAAQTAAIQAQTQAIVDLAGRIPAAGAASEADLDGVQKGIDDSTAAVNDNTAKIAALAPTT